MATWHYLTLDLGLGDRCVVAKGADKLSAYGIYTLTNELQFWVRLQYSYEGMALTPHVLMGVQRWAGPFMDQAGYRYPGDLAMLKRADLKAFLLILPLVIPVFGLIWLCMFYPTVGRLRSFFHTNSSVNLRDRLRPVCGDSSDVFILQAEKVVTAGGQDWTRLLPETEAAIEAIKAHALNGILRALSRRD